MMQVCTIAAGHTLDTTSGRPFQPVADQEEHILDAAVVQFRQDTHPELRALTTLAGPQAEDVALPIQGDADRRVERPVGHLPVANLGSGTHSVM